MKVANRFKIFIRNSRILNKNRLLSVNLFTGAYFGFKTIIYSIQWRRLEKKLKLKKNEYAFLCNAHIGDTYAFCSLAGDFVKDHPNTQFVVVTDKKQSCVPKMFQSVSKVIEVEKPLSPEAGGILFRLFRFEPGYLLPGFIRFSNAYDNNKYIKAPHEMRYPYRFILNLSGKSRVESPKAPTKRDYADAAKLFNKLNLPIGRTIILSPHAQTVKRMISGKFWERLVKECKAKNFVPVTNVVSGEDPISGTVGVTFPLNNIIANFNLAGHAIMLRSGLCDLVSSSSARISVLYPAGKLINNKFSYIQMFHIEGKNKNVREFVISNSRKMPDLF